MPPEFSRLSAPRANLPNFPMLRSRPYVPVCTYRRLNLITASQSARECGSTAGSLHGLEGVLVRNANGLRVVITVNLIQQSVAVELDADSVEAL